MNLLDIVFIIVNLVDPADLKGQEGKQGKTDADRQSGDPAHRSEFRTVRINLTSGCIAAANQNRLQQDTRQNVLGVCAFVEIFELFHTFHSLSFVDY